MNYDDFKLCNKLFDWQVKVAIFGQIYEFLGFFYFGKAVASEFLRISKNPNSRF